MPDIRRRNGSRARVAKESTRGDAGAQDALGTREVDADELALRE